MTKLKSLPTSQSFEALFAPDKEYNYFDQIAQHPFRYNSNKFQLVNAWWMAEASMLVYVREHDFVSEMLNRIEFDNVVFFEESAKGTQAFVASNSNFAVVCFRGTEIEERADIITDLKFLQTRALGGGRVHRGFESALDQVWSSLKNHLDTLTQTHGSNLKLWFTGHSLGAALATLAADRYSRVQGVYTYGSPRVGDKAFGHDYNVNTFRFVNNNDIVSMVPPPIIYHHVGALKYIDSNGHIHDNPNQWKLIKSGIEGHLNHLGDLSQNWSDRAFDDIPLDNLVDHAPIYYVTRIWNNYVKDLA